MKRSLSHRSGAASLSCLAVGVVFLVSCKDYEYRHEVDGKVLDADNKPVKGAIVRRVTDKGDQYGIDELYARTTPASGEFSFVNVGRGPQHMSSAPWKIQVEHPAGVKHTYDVAANWSDDRSGCFGYCAKGVIVILK